MERVDQGGRSGRFGRWGRCRRRRHQITVRDARGRELLLGRRSWLPIWPSSCSSGLPASCQCSAVDRRRADGRGRAPSVEAARRTVGDLSVVGGTVSGTWSARRAENADELGRDVQLDAGGGRIPFVGGNLLIHARMRRRVVIVHAHLRERRAGTTGTGEPGGEPQHRQVQVAADSYEQGRDRILAELDGEWIVAAWTVER